MSRRVLLALLALTALSLWLRVGAVSRLLPVHPEPDDSLAWVYRHECGEPVPQLNRHYGVYPMLLPWTLTIVPGWSSLPRAAPDAPLGEHLEAASAAHHRLRLLAAVISSLLVPVLFLLARRFVGDGWALVAAAFLAVGLLHQAHSSVVKAHAPGVTFAWLTLALALRQLEAPSWKRGLATALSGALAIGTVHTGFFVLPAVCMAILCTRRTWGPRGWLYGLVPLLSVAGGALFLPGFIRVSGKGVHVGGHTMLFDVLGGGGLRTWPRLFWEHDPVLAVLASLGLLAGLFAVLPTWRDRPARARALVLGAYALPYLVVISLDQTVVDRYLVPLYPLFALLAAHALRSLARRLRSPVAGPALALAALSLPAWIALRHTWIGRRPDTFEQLGDWIERQPGAGSRRLLLSPSISPRLFPTQEALRLQIESGTTHAQPWFHYLGELASVPVSAPHYDLRPIEKWHYLNLVSPGDLEAWFDEQRPDWIVLEVSRRILAFPGASNVIHTVRRLGEHLATFSGEGGRMPDRRPIDYQDGGNLAVRVLSADCNGPQLEVYRWRTPAERR